VRSAFGGYRSLVPTQPTCRTVPGQVRGLPQLEQHMLPELSAELEAINRILGDTRALEEVCEGLLIRRNGD